MSDIGPESFDFESVERALEAEAEQSEVSAHMDRVRFDAEILAYYELRELALTLDYPLPQPVEKLEINPNGSVRYQILALCNQIPDTDDEAMRVQVQAISELVYTRYVTLLEWRAEGIAEKICKKALGRVLTCPLIDEQQKDSFVELVNAYVGDHLQSPMLDPASPGYELQKDNEAASYLRHELQAAKNDKTFAFARINAQSVLLPLIGRKHEDFRELADGLVYMAIAIMQEDEEESERQTILGLSNDLGHSRAFRTSEGNLLDDDQLYHLLLPHVRSLALMLTLAGYNPEAH